MQQYRTLVQRHTGLLAYRPGNHNVIALLATLLMSGKLLAYAPADRGPGSSARGSGGAGGAMYGEKPEVGSSRQRTSGTPRQNSRPSALNAPVMAAASQNTWIEVALVGEDDRPIPHVRFEVATVDKSTVIRGKLDENGIGRIEKIKPVNYMISFPEFDKDAWEPI